MADDDPFEPMRRFSRRGEPPQADPLLCRHIRTKTWLAPDAFGVGDPTQSPSIAQYWCLKTMRAAGPDGDLVVPEECTDERICFEAALRKSVDS